MRTLPGLVLALCASIVALGVSSRDSRAYQSGSGARVSSGPAPSRSRLARLSQAMTGS
jgi:hypothetical protein